MTKADRSCGAVSGRIEPAGAPNRGGAEPTVPESLVRGRLAWVDRGDPGPLLRWLDRELEADGIPRRLPVGAWGPCLAALAEGRSDRGSDWPSACDARIERLVLALLRFSRADGSDVFGPDAPAAGRGALLRTWADWLADPTIAPLVRRWFPSPSDRRRPEGSPPLPAYGSPNLALAMLRADWSSRGDLLAIDHRDGRPPCRLELIGTGVRWMGPDWGHGPEGGQSSSGRPTFWMTGPYVDLAEWTFRTATARVVRTALLLRGRQIALLADEVTGPDSTASLRVAHPSGVGPIPIPESRCLGLAAGRGRLARVLPLALPALPYPTERGSLVAEGRDLVLRQAKDARRCWLPLLVSWRSDRNRRPVHWRTLTVSERSRACPPGVAFAVRVAWGADESLVIYRSLGPTALRAFLGHQTRARFLVGLFTKEGNVEPIVKVDG